MNKKKVVVIGGGFAGTTIARKLESKFNVVLIDSKDYFEFTPGILRTIVEPNHIRRIQVLHHHYLKRSEIVVGIVKKISKKEVYVGNRKIAYDYLVICSGSKYQSPIKEENLIITSRAAHLKHSYEKLCKSKNIIIIGGGPVGVELAAEISTHYSGKEIFLVHSKDRLLERASKKASKYAEKFLLKKKVHVLLNQKVGDSNKKEKEYTFSDGRKVHADLVFLCMGIIPNHDFISKSFKNKVNEKNQVVINDYLQVKGFDNIFAAGDINNVNLEKTAQNAENQAEIVSKNIISLEDGIPMHKYNSKTTPMVISLGKWDGIYLGKYLYFTGIIPAFMKYFIEWKEMLKFKF